MHQTIPEIEFAEAREAEFEPLYRILIHNDHVTPMDFVIQILKSVFFLANDKAAEIMLTAHIKGNAYVQTVSKSEAEKRVKQAHELALLAKFPLRFTLEPE